MDPSFRDMHHIEGGTAHMVSSKAAVVMDTPSQLGKAVLDMAKSRTVDFYFDVVLPLGGVLVSFDTDAFTFHIDPKVALVDLPHEVRDAYFDNPDCPESGVKLRGTPGLFHMESKGVAARAVGPKMICVTDGERSTKVSCKGVKRSALPEDPYPLYAAMCDGERVTVEFPSTKTDKETGNLVPTKMRRTMKST
jgi:hypothetical protein